MLVWACRYYRMCIYSVSLALLPRLLCLCYEQNLYKKLVLSFLWHVQMQPLWLEFFSWAIINCQFGSLWSPLEVFIKNSTHNDPATCLLINPLNCFMEKNGTALNSQQRCSRQAGYLIGRI